MAPSIFSGGSIARSKLHGHRIEPGEIEAVLGIHPQVAAVAVLARGEGAEAKLIAYVVGAPGRQPDAASLRQHLALRLPPWMIPAAFLVLDALPLSPNGKIDRNRLPDPAHLARPTGTPFLAPRDSLEAPAGDRLPRGAGHRPSGRARRLLQLGGDSLAAARVAARVEAASERRLPLAAFTRGATIERLALSLREAGGAVRWSPLVPLATEATGPPLLLVHPAGGTVLAYAELGQALAGAMPVYGLQAQGMEPSQAPLDQVEQMAEAYIGAARRELRPEAWRLAGWSFGAVVAFEMARQLQAAGEIVATPIALDAPARHTPPPAAEADIIQRVIRMYGEMLALQPASGGGDEEAPDRLERMVDAAVASGIFPADFGAAPARRLQP